MALEKVLALDAAGVIEKTIDTGGGGGGGGPATEFTGDLDTLVSGGPYYCTTSCTNKPPGVGGNALYLEIIYRATGQVLQIASNYTAGALLTNSTALWFRWFDGTTFSGWVPLYSAVKLTVGTTAPSSPSVGDLWVDTN